MTTSAVYACVRVLAETIASLPLHAYRRINPAVNTQELYADDQLWESVSALGKIDVEVETADLPLAIRAKILGNEIKGGVPIEKPPMSHTILP